VVRLLLIGSRVQEGADIGLVAYLDLHDPSRLVRVRVHLGVRKRRLEVIASDKIWVWGDTSAEFL
jgi:hypothetical protein